MRLVPARRFLTGSPGGLVKRGAYGLLGVGCGVGGAVARFHGLIALLVGFLAASSSYAAESPVTQYFLAGGSWQNTLQAACNARQSGSNAQACSVKVYDITATAATGNGCNETYTQCSNGAGVGTYFFGPAQTRSWCPTAGVTATNGVCPEPVNASCQANAGKSAGGYTTLTPAGGTRPSGSEVGCEPEGSSGCLVDILWDSHVTDSQGRTRSNGQGRYTGGTCNPATAQNGATGTTGAPRSVNESTPAQANIGTGVLAHNDCAPGEFYGSVNGVTTCVKNAAGNTSTTSTPSSSTTTDAQGNTVTRNTTTETTCNATICTTTRTTTTTTTPPGGGTPTTSTSSSSDSTTRTDFCSQNRNAIQCGGTGGTGSSTGNGSGNGTGTESGSFGGTCGAFTCSGDPVLCAAAKATQETTCALTKNSDEAAKYDEAKAKTGDQTGTLPGNSTVNVSSSYFSGQDMIGGSSACITDRTITVKGQSFVLPFSRVCEHLAVLRAILLAIAYVVAARIVFVRGS